MLIDLFCCTLQYWVLSKEVLSTTFWIFAMTQWLISGLPGQWQTLYPLSQWAGQKGKKLFYFIVIKIEMITTFILKLPTAYVDKIPIEQLSKEHLPRHLAFYLTWSILANINKQ